MVKSSFFLEFFLKWRKCLLVLLVIGRDCKKKKKGIPTDVRNPDYSQIPITGGIVVAWAMSMLSVKAHDFTFIDFFHRLATVYLKTIMAWHRPKHRQEHLMGRQVTRPHNPHPTASMKIKNHLPRGERSLRPSRKATILSGGTDSKVLAIKVVL